MNEVATFFRNREKDRGQTYQLEIGSARNLQRVAVYAQRPLDTHDWASADLTFQDIRGTLAAQGGGLIVAASDEHLVRRLTVTRVKPYQAPEHCIVLAPGRPPAPLKTDGAAYPFPTGSHVIVPVDEEAGERLQNFIAYLGWLSPDIEALVLNAIRRPSLDRRLNRLETKLLGQTADEAISASDSRFGRMKERIANAWRSRAARVAAAVLLVLAAGTIALWRYRPLLSAFNAVASTMASSDTEGTGTTASTNTTQTSGTAGGTAEADTAPYVEEAKRLFEAIRAKKDEDSLLAAIDNVHFASISTGALTHQQVNNALRPRRDGETGDGNRPVLLGLVKLQMLDLGADPKSPNFIEPWNSVTVIKGLYAKLPAASVDAKPNARVFLSALACRLRYNPPLPFEGDCSVASDKDLETGLRGLNAYVERRR